MVLTPEIFSAHKPSQHGIIRRYITVKNDFIGFHAYKDAPEQVAFLRYNHRHKFLVTSIIEVFHDDRELEFFMVQEELERKIIPYVTASGNIGSCEQLAQFILQGLVNTYGDHRWTEVCVSEDGENSATVTWDTGA